MEITEDKGIVVYVIMKMVVKTTFEKADTFAKA